MKILNIVESAYRATLEEQDDTIIWLSRLLEKAGADLTVLLRGNAVNYLVKQECPKLSIGDSGVLHPAQPDQDIEALQSEGVQIYALGEDIDERGISRAACSPSVQVITRSDVSGLMEKHDQVWHW